jgi:hypothetical protein
MNPHPTTCTTPFYFPVGKALVTTRACVGFKIFEKILKPLSLKSVVKMQVSLPLTKKARNYTWGQ